MTLMGLKPSASMKNGSRRGCFTSLLVAFLLSMLIGEIALQKVLLFDSVAFASCRKFMLPVLSIPSSFADPSFKPLIQLGPSIHQAFTGKTINVSAIPTRVPRDMHTHFEENTNILGYGLSVARNVCFDPDGRILLVGISEEEVESSLKASPALEKVWHSSYNCSWGCIGSVIASQAPEDAVWIEGNTTHIIPYLANVFHNFADRVWPHIAGFQAPLSFTTPKPINHIAVYLLSTWLDQAHHNNERATFLYQFLMLARLSPGADFPLIPQNSRQSVCYERLTLDCSSCDRISNFLGSSIVSPALLRYRSTVLSFFNIAEPHVSLPPLPLRVTFYGRGDASRRRVTNAQQVVEHLRSWRQPQLEVTFVDELLANGEYNQTFPEVVSLFSQTDIFITVHGANTWASLFMPRGAAVIEIYGPCGPSSWLHTIVTALELKHSTESNPWKESFASARAGNTTNCEDALRTPDFSLDIEKLDRTIHELSQPSAPSDRIPLHWLYNWTAGSYEVGSLRT
ncbi:hypothetical protein O6H91_15G014700 [Diphasiastrum complanatum]|uniref:Uncharacterized protein n=1 Tax=Diphasiastrum complanatum TaxID=34168 RepID=A0ACC2BG61_DIPCM|nr:hypothetical protein O6H91_15G014700 [Diphasiastrum complanatum]